MIYAFSATIINALASVLAVGPVKPILVSLFSIMFTLLGSMPLKSCGTMFTSNSILASDGKVYSVVFRTVQVYLWNFLVTSLPNVSYKLLGHFHLHLVPRVFTSFQWTGVLTSPPSRSTSQV